MLLVPWSRSHLKKYQDPELLGEKNQEPELLKIIKLPALEKIVFIIIHTSHNSAFDPCSYYIVSYYSETE